MSRFAEKGRSVFQRPFCKNFLRRWVSGVLSLCLALPAPAFAAEIPAAKKTEPLLQPGALRLPSEIGKVEEVFGSDASGPAVYFIQDAHAVFDAQKNIAEIIRYLRQNSGVEHVAFEGGSGVMDAAIVRTLPDEFLKKQILENFMRRGELSGVSWAAVYDDARASYSGLEDWKLYEQNYFAFLRAQDVRERALESLDQAMKKLEEKRGSAYPADLDLLHKVQEENLSGQGFAAWVRALGEAGGRHGLLEKEEMENRFPEFFAFLKASSGIRDPERAERWVRDFGNDFQKQYLFRLNASDAPEFNRRWQAFLTGQDDFIFFLYYLQQLSVKNDLKVEFPDFVKGWLDQADTLTSLEGSRLMMETETLTHRIEDALAQTAEQKEILAACRSLRLMRKLAALQLSLSEFKKFQADEASHELKLTPQAAELLEPARDFYESALKRDPVFMQKVEAMLLGTNGGPAVVVAGGFHRASMTEKLREKKIPYAVITPHIDSLEGSELYEKIMLGEVSFADKLQDSFYKAFMSEFVRQVSLKKGDGERLRLGKEWRDSLLRELASRQKLGFSGAYLAYLDDVFRPDSSGGAERAPEWEYLSEKIKILMREFRSEIEKQIFTRFDHERGQWLAGAEKPLAAHTLNASASVDILIPDSPNGRNSPVMRAAREGWRSVLSSGALQPKKMTVESGEQKPAPVRAAAPRSELRALDQDVPAFARYRLSGIDFSKSAPVYRGENEFANASAQAQKKTLAEVRRDISDAVFSDHEKMRLEYGFLARDHSPQARTVYEIFDKVVEGYNLVAQEQGWPLYTGKLFIVDSPDDNAFVHSEHPDVYLYAGLLQDLERYSVKRGFALTHEHVAAILAHELSHVMQNSAYVGASYSDAEFEGRLPQEVLVMKRNAEYDADRNAIHILTKAGYTPRIFTDTLQFLADITPESTAEHSFSDHPHPSLRISEIMRALNDSKLITLSWDEPLHPFPGEQSFVKMPSTHLRGFEEVETLDDFLALENQVDSLQKVLELGKMAGERTSLSRVKALSREEENRKFFAQTVLGFNVMALAKQIFNQALEEEEKPEAFPVTETGAVLESPALGVEDMDVLGFEVIAREEDKRGLSSVQMTSSRHQEAVMRQLSYVLVKLNSTAKPGPGMHQKKIQAIEALRALAEAFNKQYDSADYQTFDTNEAGRTLQEEAAEMIGSGRAAALERLGKIPYSVYLNFNKEYLRSEEKLRFEGIQLGGISLERGSAALYREPLEFSKTDTPAQRRRALDIALYSWVYDRVREDGAGRAAILLERLAERAKTLITALPESSRTGDPAVDGPALDAVRNAAAVLIKTGKFPEDEGLLRRLMQILTTTQSPEGPAVFPVASQQRSPLFERETGLGYFTLEKSKGTAKAFQHQDPYLEMAGESQRAAEILADDFKREGEQITPGTGGKINVQEVFRRNLQLYSPYFRKAVIRNFLRNQRSGKSLAEVLNPALYRHVDVYAGLREMAGEADGFQWMVEFMKAKRFDRIPEKTFANRAEETAFLEDYADFFEKTLLPARPADGFMIPRESAAAFLKARLRVLEERGMRPENLMPEFVSSMLDLLSRHTLLEINDKAEGKITGEAEHDPRLAQISRDRISNRAFNIEGLNQMPVAFFDAPQTLLEHTLFQRFMGLSLQDLKAIAAHQERLLSTAADTPRQMKGRFPIRTDASDEVTTFFYMLNTQMIRKILEGMGADPEELLPSEASSAGHEGETRNGEEDQKIYFSLYLGGYSGTAKMILNYFKRHPGVNRKEFWKQLGEVLIKHNSGMEGEDYIGSDGTNSLINYLFQSGEAIDLFFDAAPLMEEVYAGISPQAPGSFTEPTSYLSVLSKGARANGFKQELFKRFAFATRSGPRTLLNTRKRPALEILQDLTGNFLTVPSVLRDGMIDMLERQLFPEVHKSSRISPNDWQTLLSDNTDSLEWFFSKTLMEIPVEWMDLSENFPSRIKTRRAKEILAFYDQAIPAVADPQRQLRFGAAAMKVWRLSNPKASFQEELAAVERYFPHPTKLRDDALEELFNRHAMPSEDVSYKEVQRAQRLYSIYHRMIFEHEATNADAAFQAVQSMVSSGSRQDRMQTALWILNPDNPMPQPFLVAKQEKNILFDDLPRDLRFAPEFLKTDMLMNLLTGENGILNPKTADDREIKKEFAARVFEHFFPLEGNTPSETGLSNEVLVLLKEMFVFALDQYDQGRGAAIIDTLRSIEGQLANKTYGQRLAVLLGSLGPVGVKIGQILSENQELVPDARLRRDLASLKHGAESISKIAVIEALIAAGLDPSEFRVGRLLGAASMKQVHAGFLLVNGEWKEVVFKVLRPALNRSIEQDLRVMENMFAEPAILGKIRAFVPGFEPEEMVRKIRFMIDEERDFLKESENSRTLGEVVDSYPSSLYQYRGVSVRMPKIIKELPTVIVEERIRGLEADVLQHKGFLGRTAWAKAMKRELNPAEARRILALNPDRILRLARNHFFYQVFERGIFHADPHAGNLMVEDGHLVFIDAGLIGRLAVPPQVEAARVLVKGVVLWEPEMVFQGFRDMLESVGDTLESPEEFRAGIEHAFRPSNMGNLNKLLNELGGLIARQRGGASAQAGAFIKAWTQALWLMPMTPAALSDLSRILKLSRGETFKAIVVTGIPNLVLQPFRWLSQFFSRVKSSLQELRELFVRKIQLYRAGLRFRKLQDNIRGAVSDFMNAMEDKAKKNRENQQEQYRSRNVMPSAPLVKIGSVSNGPRSPLQEWTQEPGVREIQGASFDEIKEAVQVYGEYAAFLLKADDESMFGINGIFSEDEERLLESFWELQGGEVIMYDKKESKELVIRMLARLYLARKKQNEGKPYKDLLGFASAEQEYLARRILQQYLAGLDAEDQLNPLPKGPDGTLFSRRQLVLEKFPSFVARFREGKNPTPWIRFASLDIFKPGWRTIFMVKNPAVLTFDQIEKKYTMQKVEDEPLPAYAKSRQLRGNLKKQNGSSYSFFADRRDSPQSMVVRVRERFTSRENPVTFRVEVHNFQIGESVIMHFTDATYAEFLKTGRVSEFIRYRFQIEGPGAEALVAPPARSELRRVLPDETEPRASLPGASPRVNLAQYEALAFLLGPSASSLAGDSLNDVSEKNLRRFQAVLSRFVSDQESRLARVQGAEALRAMLTAPDYEKEMLRLLTSEMERNGFVPSDALRPVFEEAVAKLVERMRALLPAPPKAQALSAAALKKLTPEGRALLEALDAIRTNGADANAILAELKQSNPGKYDGLQSLDGVFSAPRENIPWMISLANLLGSETEVQAPVRKYLEDHFEKAGVDFGVLYGVGSAQENLARSLKQGFQKIWPVGVRFGEAVKEGKLPAALRLGTGLYVLLTADQRFDPAAGETTEDVRGVHVAEDVTLAPEFSTVEKIKINSLPLLNPYLEQHALPVDGSKFRLIDREVFNFFVDLVNDLARIKTVQQMFSASA